jgi:hypothetical protein
MAQHHTTADDFAAACLSPAMIRLAYTDVSHNQQAPLPVNKAVSQREPAQPSSKKMLKLCDRQSCLI